MNSVPQNIELNKVSRTLHGLGFACVTITGLAIYFFLILPLHSRADLFGSDADRVVQFLQSDVSIKQANEQLLAQVEQQQKRWDKLLDQIPETAQESVFLEQITKLGQTNHLKISSFSPGSSRELKTCKQKAIQLSLTGSYLNLCHFLAELDSVPRVTNIDHLTITSPNQTRSDGNYIINISFHLAYEFNDVKTVAKI